MMAAKTEVRRQVQSLKKIAETVSERCQRQGLGQKLVKETRLLSELSLIQWWTLLKERNGENGPVRKPAYSVFTLQPLHIRHLRVCRLFKSYLIQCLSCGDVYSHPLEPAGRRKKLSFPKIPVLKACIRILPNGEKRSALLGLLVNFAEKENGAHLKGLLTGDGMQRMLEKRTSVGLIWFFSLWHRFLTA